MAQEGTERFVRIQSRCDTTENWEFYNPILAKNEVGYDTTNKSYKIGDGETSWLNLPYSTAGMIKGNGEVFNDYENNYADGQYSHAGGYSSKAIGTASIAHGYSTTAGCKGYYWSAISLIENNLAIYLSEIEVSAPKLLSSISEEADYINTNFTSPEYDLGDRIYVRNGTTHITTATITSIQNNKISFEYTSNFPIDSIKSGAHLFSVPAKPDIGVVSISMGMSAFGESTVAAGENSFVAGYGGIAGSNFATALGRECFSGYAGLAAGFQNKALGDSSVALGRQSTATGRIAYAEGVSTLAAGEGSHAEGYLDPTQNDGTRGAIGKYSHSEGANTSASGEISHAEGNSTKAIGKMSHAEGYLTITNGENSHAEGWQTRATGKAAHAEGYLDNTYKDSRGATGLYAHSETENTLASGRASHAEGRLSQATAQASHAEGQNTQATMQSAHSEGENTQANGKASHAEGYNSKAIGLYSHAEGVSTVANGDYQHVQGKFNAQDNTSAFIIGNGTADNDKSRSNAMTVDWSGNVKIAGQLQDMNGNSLSAFIEKEITIPSGTIGGGEDYIWNPDTSIGQEGTFYCYYPFSKKEIEKCDLRIPPIIVPYTNDEYGNPLMYADKLTQIDIKGMKCTWAGADLPYSLYFEVSPEYNDITNYDNSWKILFWRKKQ